MLADPELFEDVEATLRDEGVIDKFEKDNGKILGRVMIVKGEVPDDLDIEVSPNSSVFICTFDFYDYSIGIVFDTLNKKAESGIWFTQQTDSIKAVEPSEDWVKFFIEKLMMGINEDGSYWTPIYSLVNNTSDITMVPTL